MRYRFRKGATELELEYDRELPEEQAKLVSSLLGHFVEIFEGAGPEADEAGETKPVRGQERKSRRGGRRTAFVSPKIEELIQSKWLVEKSTADVVEKLKLEGVVAANEENVVAALQRKVPHKLARLEREGKVLWTVHSMQ